MIIELKKGYTIESRYDKFTDSYITRLLDPESKQVRDALYSGDMVGRNYDILEIRDFFTAYMNDPNFNTEPVTDFENEDSIEEQPVEPEEEFEEEPIEEALDPELEKKARRTRKATRKAKLPMTRIMPDYGAGIDKFNSFTADGNSGMASTTGSTGLGEAYMSRDELIRTLKKMGFNYNMDRFSDGQLYRIMQERQKALQKREAEKKKQEHEDAYDKQKKENAGDSFFKNGIEFESENAARDYFGEAMEKKFYINDMHESWMMEDESLVETQPLNESAEKKDNGFRTINEAIKHFEHKHFDETYEDLELGVLYESMRDRLSSDDIRKLGAFMNHAQDPEEVITYMKGLLSDDRQGNSKIKTEALNESYGTDVTVSTYFSDESELDDMVEEARSNGIEVKNVDVVTSDTANITYRGPREELKKFLSVDLSLDLKDYPELYDGYDELDDSYEDYDK